MISDTSIMYNNMAAREQRQNYVFRFKLEPTIRKNSGNYYFADLDKTTDGGSFMSKYFNYKLVDMNNEHISSNLPNCGVMLKASPTEQVSSLSASFALPDLSNTRTKVMTKEVDGVEKTFVGNMINFEIITAPYANVTILAAPVENGKPAAIGIYKVDDEDIEPGTNYFTQNYDNPDYAFFMPDDDHLAYFDYGLDANETGQIGKWALNESTGEYSISPADYSTDAIIPNAPGYSEYGHNEGKTRIFAHTFYLPRGRYCIGSASGAYERDGNQVVQTNRETTAKIFYVCAQGQNAGQAGYNDNVFSGNDIVDKVDFIKQPRFAANGTPNITLDSISKYMDQEHPEEFDRLDNQRLYLALYNSERSLFSGDYESNLIFEYKPNAQFVVDEVTKTGYFEISSSLSSQDLLRAILRVSVNNYNHSLEDKLTNPKVLYIKLFDRDPSSSSSLSYSPPGGS